MLDVNKIIHTYGFNLAPELLHIMEIDKTVKLEVIDVQSKEIVDAVHDQRKEGLQEGGRLGPGPQRQETGAD